MASVNHLELARVKEYDSLKDVPYDHDYTYGHFKGSYGVVYRATRSAARLSRGQNSVYAIKEIQAVSFLDQEKVAQEINLLRQLQHTNIIQFEEAYTIKTSAARPLPTIYLVTRPWAPVSLQHFIEDVVRNSGESTMCSWLKPGQLDPWPSIMLQCLSGLAYLHAQEPRPIRHKDIKPHNILLYYDPQAKEDAKVRPIIIDFGISKEHIDHATTANTGTYEYKAPEQIRKEEPTLKSDVFSLGCCFVLVEGIASPWPALSEVYEAALGTDACQFASNICLVNRKLQTLHESQICQKAMFNHVFLAASRVVIRSMLVLDPVIRSSAAMAFKHLELVHITFRDCFEMATNQSDGGKAWVEVWTSERLKGIVSRKLDTLKFHIALWSWNLEQLVILDSELFPRPPSLTCQSLAAV